MRPRTRSKGRKTLSTSYKYNGDEDKPEGTSSVSGMVPASMQDTNVIPVVNDKNAAEYEREQSGQDAEATRRIEADNAPHTEAATQQFAPEYSQSVTQQIESQYPAQQQEPQTLYQGPAQQPQTRYVSQQQPPAPQVEPDYVTRYAPQPAQYDNLEPEHDPYEPRADERYDYIESKMKRWRAMCLITLGVAVLTSALAFRAFADNNDAVTNGMESSEQINELTRQKTDLEQERDALNFRIDDLNNQIDKQNKEKDDLAGQLADAQAQRDKANARADDAQREIDRLNAQLEEQRNRGANPGLGLGIGRGNTAPVPSLTGLDVDSAVAALENAGFQAVQIQGAGNTVVSQQPAAGVSANKSDQVTITAQ